MAQNFSGELSKQKTAIITVVLLITMIWSGVFYLEYTISGKKNEVAHFRVEENLCLYVPIGCKFSEDNAGVSFYCSSGTAGKLINIGRDRVNAVAVSEAIEKTISGERGRYLLRLKVNEDKNKDLGKVIACPKK